MKVVYRGGLAAVALIGLALSASAEESPPTQGEVNALLSRSAYSQDQNGVAHQYLQRHGVPCRFVLKVGIPSNFGAEVATCQDGREWVLMWLENEIAFVHPRTHELYRWDRHIHISHPEIYIGPNSGNENQMLPSDGP